MSEPRDSTASDLHSYLQLPMTYLLQLNESLERRVIRDLERLELSKEKIEQFRLQWKNITTKHISNSNSEILSEISSSNIATVDPAFNKELEKLTGNTFVDKNVCGIEERINELCARTELERKSLFLSSLKGWNTELTESCDQIKEKIQIDHKASNDIYELVKDHPSLK